MQGDQNALAFVVRSVLEEVRDGAAIAVGQLRQLQRGDGSIPRFDLGDRRAGHAKGICHCPLAQPLCLTRGSQPASELDRVHESSSQRAGRQASPASVDVNIADRATIVKIFLWWYDERTLDGIESPRR